MTDSTLNLILGLPILDAGGGPSPPPAYTADAVHWANATPGADYISAASALGAADSYQFTMSAWTYSYDDSGSDVCSDFNGNWDYGINPAGSDPPFPDKSIQWDFYGPAAARVTVLSAGSVITLNSWQHVLFSCDLNFNLGLKLAAAYVNDVFVPLSFLFDTAGPFSILFSQTLWTTGFSFGPLDQSDTFMAPGLSIVQGDGTISVANRRKFITAGGKPANPTGFPPGLVLNAGDASTFAVNQGTGGATFDLMGAITNAPSSPSD